MEPKFCIITTTYQRPDAILQCTSSVHQQAYRNYLHIVVIDDVVSDYSHLRSLTETRSNIHIITNAENLGKNASVNKAFTHLRANNFAGYIIFLDDDDWLTPNCLQDFADFLHQTPDPWIVSQRAESKSHKSFTQNTTHKNRISYQYDCLLRKKFSGDATHCIDFNSTQHIQFPTSVRNAEEWLYFSHLSTIHSHFTYLPKIGTLSHGYSPEGLTSKYHEHNEKDVNIVPLIKETISRHIFSPLIYVYICARLIRSFI